MSLAAISVTVSWLPIGSMITGGMQVSLGGIGFPRVSLSDLPLWVEMWCLQLASEVKAEYKKDDGGDNGVNYSNDKYFDDYNTGYYDNDDSISDCIND